MIHHVYHSPATHSQHRGDAGRNASKEALEAERARDIAFLFKGRKPIPPRGSAPILEKDRRWKSTNREMMSMRAASRRGGNP